MPPIEIFSEIDDRTKKHISYWIDSAFVYLPNLSETISFLEKSRLAIKPEHRTFYDFYLNLKIKTIEENITE